MRGLLSNEVLIQIWGKPLISCNTLQMFSQRWDLREFTRARGHVPSAHLNLTPSSCSRVRHLMMIEGSSFKVRICEIAATHPLKSVTDLSLINRAETVVLSNVMAPSPPILSRDWTKMHPGPPATLHRTQVSFKHLLQLSHNRARIMRTNLKRQLCKPHTTLTLAMQITCKALQLHLKIKNSRKSWSRETTSLSSMFHVLLRRSSVWRKT